jgi:hypothetical protein
MKKEVIGLLMVLVASTNLYAQSSSDSPATIALAKKLGLAKISDCLFGLSMTLSTYEPLKNSSVQDERDTYKGVEEIRLSYGILGQSYGSEKFQAAVKKAIAATEGKPNADVLKSTAKNCMGEEIFQYTRTRNRM